MLLVQGQAYRQQYGFNVIHLIPVNLYGPGDNFDPASVARHPGADQEVRRRARARRRPHRGLGHRQRPRASSCTSTTRPRASSWPPSATTAPSPVNLGVGHEITIRDLVELIAELTGFEGEIRWDATKPDGQPRRALDTSRARERFGFEAKTSFEDGLRATIDWYSASCRQGQFGPTRSAGRSDSTPVP